MPTSNQIFNNDNLGSMVDQIMKRGLSLRVEEEAIQIFKDGLSFYENERVASLVEVYYQAMIEKRKMQNEILELVEEHFRNNVLFDFNKIDQIVEEIFTLPIGEKQNKKISELEELYSDNLVMREYAISLVNTFRKIAEFDRNEKIETQKN